MLENFARNVNAHTFKDIYGSWLNWRDFADLAGKIEGALNGARTIRVNLDGLVQSVDDLPRIIELGARGIHFEGVTATGTRMGNITNWEVFTIYTNPALRERAVFYLNGQPVRVP
jgi:hypothetical protein